MSAGNFGGGEVIPGDRSQGSGSLEGRKVSTRVVLKLVTAVGTGVRLCWNLLRSNVECDSKLLPGRKKEEGIDVSAPISHGQGLFHQRFILLYSSLHRCECHLVPTSIPHLNVREDLEHKPEGMQTSKAKVLSDYIFV